jgi:hypothetical protein
MSVAKSRQCTTNSVALSAKGCNAIYYMALISDNSLVVRSVVHEPRILAA